MKKVVILGSGAGGTMVAAKLRKELDESEWKITIIDNDEIHHYQPGWLFIPFGAYTPEDCAKPQRCAKEDGSTQSKGFQKLFSLYQFRHLLPYDIINKPSS